MVLYSAVVGEIYVLVVELPPEVILDFTPFFIRAIGVPVDIDERPVVPTLSSTLVDIDAN